MLARVVDYRPTPAASLLIPIAFVVFAAVAVFLVVQLVRGGERAAVVRAVVGRFRIGTDLAKVTLDDGRTITVMVRAGFAGLVSAIREGAPHADVQGV